MCLKLVRFFDGIFVFDVANDHLDVLLLEFLQMGGFGLCCMRGSKDRDAVEFSSCGEDCVQDERANLTCCTEKEDILRSHGIRPE